MTSKRLTPELEQEILQVTQEKLKIAENYFYTYLDPVITEAYQIYEADPEYYKRLFPRLSQEVGNIQTADVMAKVEWILPQLLRIFFGSDDIVVIRGRTEEDDKSAKLMQALVNWQLQVLNPSYMVFYHWFKDALITGVGYIKCYWERIYDYKTVEEVIDVGLVEYYREDENIRNFRVLKDLGNGLVKVRYELKYPRVNQPVVEFVPSWEVVFTPDGKRLEECSFVAHRKRVSADYLRRKGREGVYKNYEEAIERGSNSYSVVPSQAMFQQLPDILAFRTQDSTNPQFWLYECYTKYDINGDGLLEDVIVTLCNNVVLAVQENVYKRPPIFMLSPVPEPARIVGRGLAHLIGQYQNIKTFLLRQIILNLALTNQPKIAVDVSSVEVEDLLNNNAFIRIKPLADGKQAIFPVVAPPPNPQSFNMLEWVEMQLENESGVTRYNQGLDARSLNKTATGVSLIMQASSARIENIARLFAETAITDLFRFLVYLNQLFITEETVIRLLNEPLVIKPDDLKGEFDLIVNVGVAVSSKQETLTALDKILNIQLQLMQLGIVTPQQVQNTVERMLETLGFKNTKEFVGGQNGVGEPAGGIYNQPAQERNGGQESSGVLRGLMGSLFSEPPSDTLQGVAEQS